MKDEYWINDQQFPKVEALAKKDDTFFIENNLDKFVIYDNVSIKQSPQYASFASDKGLSFMGWLYMLKQLAKISVFLYVIIYFSWDNNYLNMINVRIIN